MISATIDTAQFTQLKTSIKPLANRSDSKQRLIQSLVVIDQRVDHYNLLADSVTNNADYIVLRGNQDGIEQITAAIHNCPAINHLYIIAHGVSGGLYLGNRKIDASQIDAYAEQFQQWFSDNRSQATLYLYACDVAAGASGPAFIEKLHRLTGANIAASTTPIGCPTQGGNWQLDYQLQPVAANLPIAQAALMTYPGLLSAPVITDSLTLIRGTAEDTNLSISGISISDADGEVQTVTLSVTTGMLSLASTANLTVNNNNSGTITLSGAIADINAAINGMTYVPPANFADNVTLAISTNDGTQTVSRNISLAVTPVNDAPTIAPAAPNVLEGGTVSFAVGNFGITDLDNQDVQIIVKIDQMPAKGYLTLGGSRLVVGSTFSYDQVAQLQYHHDGTQTTIAGGTSDSFKVTVDDGAGGTISATTIPITIAPVNQLPTVSSSNSLYEGQTDYPVVITINDVDQTAANFTIRITSLPADGILKLNGNAVVVNQVLSSADLPNLTYSHDGNDQNNGFPPDVSFDIQVIDDGGGTGVPGSTATTVTLQIKPNNDDPILLENTGLVYNTSDIPAGGFWRLITADQLKVTDVDSATTQLTYTLTAAPDASTGSLQLNRGSGWQILGAGASFTQDDLDKNRVRYVFHKNAAGVFNDSFSFEVRDGEIREYPSVREGGIWQPDGSALAINTFDLTITVPTGGPGGTVTPDITVNAFPTKIIVGTATGLEAGPEVTITQAMLEYTDVDNAPSTLVYRVVQLPTSGVIKVNGQAIGRYGSFTQQDINDGKVTFLHGGEEDFLDGFTFTVSDGKNVTVEEIFKFDITPQNDTPTVTVNGSPVIAEGTSVVIDNTYLTMADVDGSGEKSGTGFATVNTLTFKITNLPTHGKLQVDQGSGFVDVTTATVLTKAELDGGKLRYVHNGSENFADSFSVQANDNTTGTSNNLSTIQTINIEIAKLNDDPASLSAQHLIVAEAGNGTIKGSNGLSVGEPHLVYSDPDNTTIQRQYRVTDAVDNGTLFLNGKALSIGSVFTQDDLDNNRITYTHNGSENYTDSFNFTVSDGGGAAVPGTYNITITPANDPPTLNVPGSQNFSTTSPLEFSSTNSNRIVVGDVDLDIIEPGETDILKITLDLQASGITYTGSTLTLGSTANLNFVSGSSGTTGGKIIFTGTKADVQAALDGLKVQVPNDEDRTLSLVVTVDDLLNGAPGSSAVTGETVTKTIAINASNVNDPATITKPASVTVNEDTPLSFTSGNAISITDVDAFGTTNNTVTLSVTQGTLTVTDPSLITAGANNSSTLTLTGSLTAINAALASLSYQGNSEFNGNDSLSITYDDKGNLGTGGAQIITQTVAINVTPVNDTPTLSAPSTTQTIADNTALVFSGTNAISIDDALDLPNNGLDTFSVTLTAKDGATPYGTIDVTNGTGATVTDDGSSTVTITGTKAQINAALNNLSYTPVDFNSEKVITLSITVNDNANGGTAIGGIGGALTAQKDVIINISGTNNAPVITAPTSITATEDTQFSFVANSIVIDDPDDFGQALQVKLSVGNGEVTLEALSGLTIVGGSNGSSSVTVQGTEANINAALNTLKYQGNTDYNTINPSKDALSIEVNDLGNTGIGGAKTTTQVVDISVTPVNDAPVATGSATITSVPEDSASPAGAIISSLLSSNYSDVKDTVAGGTTATSLAGIAIVGNASTAAQGTWQYDSGSGWMDIPISGLSNNAALVIPATAQLRFLPTANFNGTPGALSVRLSDGTSFTAGSSQNISGSIGGSGGWSSSTVAIGTSITEVNDAPVASGASTLTAVNEDAGNPVGDTVSNLFTDRFNDSIDQVTGGSSANTLVGIAIVGNAATTQGIWQYYNGTSWQAVGTPSNSSALLVESTDKLRFLPSAHFNGAVPALTMHLIDSSIGTVTTGNVVDLSGVGATGGTAAYSASTVPLTTTINAVNDAPTLTSLGGSVSFTENGAALVLDGDAIVDDVELGGSNNWSGATLTLQRSGSANSQDVFGNSGNLDPLTQGSSLVVAGTTIGTVTTNSNGSLVLTFNANATTALVNSALQQITYLNNSEDPPTSVAIAYTLNDGNTGAQGSGGAKTATGTVTVNITPINDAPNLTAGTTLAYTENQSGKVIDDTITLGDVDDTHIAGATAEITSGFTIGDMLAAVTSGTNITASYSSVTGILTLSGTDTLANYQQVMRSVTYFSTSEEPTQTTATRTVTWQVTDANSDGAGAQTSSATSSINVNALPDPVDDSFVTNEDTAINGNVADTDVGDGPANYTQASSPANGTLIFNSNGTFTYTPNADFNGTDSFTYTVTDQNGDAETATVTITVNPVQDIQNDTAATDEDVAVNINVLNNDSFNAAAQVTGVTNGANGVVTINPDGTVKYTPNPNFNGSDTFTYTVTSGGVTETATVNVTIDPVPDAVDDLFTTNEDIVLNGTVADTDAGNNPATYVVTTAPIHGSLTLNTDGSFTYTPNADFHGNDSFTYTVTDANGDSNTAIAQITVNPVKDIQDDSTTTDEDQAIDIAVLTNDTFKPGATVTGVTNGTNGTVTINGDGTVKYTPNADFNGTDSFTYTVTTAAGNTETATVNVTVNPLQDIQNDTATTDEDSAVDIDVLDNDSFDPSAQVTSVTQGTNGTVTINPDGTVKYDPNADFNGSDTFTYTVTSGGKTETATVTVTVNPIQDIQDDTASTNEDSAVDIDVLGNDSFDPGAQVTGVTQGANGTVTINPDGTVKYDPNVDFNGSDTFTYTVTSGGKTETATVTVTVNPIQDIQDDTASTNEDQAVDIDVLDNDSFDPGAQVTSVTQGSNGTVTINPDGTVKYDPNADFNGTDTFTYTVTSGGKTETATVNVTVNPIQDIQDDTATTDEDQAVDIDVLDNDSFDPGAQVTGVTQGANGTVTINPDGTVKYAPDADFNGSDTFAYTVTSGGKTETATVNVTVNPIQDIQNDTATTDEDQAVDIDVLDNDSFDPGAQVTGVTQGTNGTVTINPDGTVKYDPNADFNGSDTFTYTVTSGGKTETATVTVTVGDVQDIQNDTATTDEDQAVDIDVLDNDSFDPGAQVTGVTQGANGTVTINPDGTVKYDPNADFNGTDTFTYTVTSGGKTETATVNVTVNPIQDIQDDTATTDEEQAVDIDVLDNDSFDPGAQVTSVTQGANGTVTINPDGTVKYDPNADFNGSDTFTYTVTSGGKTETATVNVTVGDVQDIQNDTATTDEDQAVDIDVLDNDSFDPGAQVTGVTQGANGTVTINPDGTVKYDPNADFNGTDTFTYTVTSGGKTETATVTVTVNPIQDIQDDTASTNEDQAVDIDVLDNDSFDPGAQVTGVTQGTNGTVTINPDGTVKYDPNADFNGTDTFTYTVTSGGKTETATVNVNVNPIQDIQDDTATTDEDQAVDIDVLDNDSFDPGAQVTGVTQGANGKVTINPDGTVKYDPNADFHGSDTFTYTVTSGGKTETATVNVTVKPIQDAFNDQRRTLEDTPIDIDILGNDRFSSSTTVTGTTQGQNGQVAINLDNTVTYTPNLNFRGTDQFTYTVTTAAGNTETATVVIYVDSDVDGDGISDAEDLDDDNDGILDTDEQQGNPLHDNDSDGIIDSLDLDSDGDGITDLEESGLSRQEIDALDQDHDGAIDPSQPFGKNGLADAVETQPESGLTDYNNDGVADRPVDTDGDGKRDFQDLDSDNDGINDVVEAGGQDKDGNGLIDGQTIDNDGNGLSDTVDPHQGGQPLPIPDTDGDSRADFRDLDSDNDGLPDLMEAGFDPDQFDQDRDGIVDQGDADQDGIRDLVDGSPNQFGDKNGPSSAQLPDADQDSIPDYREIDSNNNGVPDRLEAKLPNGINTPDANSDGRIDDPTDRDQDGIPDTIDSKKGIFGGFDFTDTDGDGVPDTSDRDDDNDGIPDVDEGDLDTDQDGIPDTLDLDSDNDGIPDVTEGGGIDLNGDGVIDGFVDRNQDGLSDSVDPKFGGLPLPLYDTDGDGKRDFQDRDSDNDGILDVIEAGGSDPDGDGAIGVGFPLDNDGNGLPDIVDPKNNGKPLPVPDTDGDKLPDYRDLDSDNDSIPDVIEAGGNDPDGDGIIGTGTPVDTNNNGIDDSVDRSMGGTPLNPPDQDGDGFPNYRDLDSDNDGIPDIQEYGNQAFDQNGDGIVDGGDQDRDGLIDPIDGSPNRFGSVGKPIPSSPDQNGNGIPDYLEPPSRKIASQGADRATGGDGNDILNGFSDLDILSGGGGDDIINGGSDKDILRGDDGNDLINGGSNSDDMEGGIGNDILNGGTGNDKMLGNDGNDILNGGRGKDYLDGGQGNDRITGNEGNDLILGGEGNDRLIGDRGNDRIVGGFGKDRITGGQGRDTYIYSSAKDMSDVITDFEILKDRFDLKQLFKGAGGSMEDVRFKQRGQDTLIQVDVNGWRNLALLQDVNTDTLGSRHFIF